MSGEARAAAIRPGPLAALAGVAIVTVLWWGLALWPSAGAPEWIARARLTCFGVEAGGLPDASGWMALVLQPGVMLAVLATIWGRELGESFRGLARSRSGRFVLASGLGGFTVAGGLAGVRVASALAPSPAPTLAAGSVRWDRPAPPLELIDQEGRPFRLADEAGRPVILTFAFGHCETVCPLVVRQAREARRGWPGPSPRLVVVTLDPWRDPPARLPRLAEKWGLGPGDRVLGGSVADVTRALDAWEVPRSRDPDTGDVTHSPLTYVVDGAGRIAYRTTGDAGTLVRLAESM